MKTRGGLGEIQNPFAQRIEEGTPDFSLSPMGETQLPGGGSYNIVEILPDFVTLHCREKRSVVPAGIAQVDVGVGAWVLPFDGFVITVEFELAPDNDANLGDVFLRVGMAISRNDQTQAITNEIDPFWSQISGTKGEKVRVYRPFTPYGQRVRKGQTIIAELQYHTLGAGAAFNIEFDVQVKILDLDRMVLSA